MTEHLARLCLEGAGSTGQYTPHAFNLRLLGTRQAADHIVYLHEVHHAALNDVTAWGTALHLYARLPDSAPTFIRLLDSCRRVHESLATFASVQIATARHGALDDVLAAYPQYIPLYRATVNLTSGVTGPNRRQQVATALARVCMQTPILDVVAEVGLREFALSSVRAFDRPDTRWNWFLRQGPGPIAAAADVADRVVVDEFGTEAITSDQPGGDLYSALDRSHDAAWDRWELAAYDHFRTALAATGATVLPLNGHHEGTARLLELAHTAHGDLGLRAAMTAEQRRTDADIASSVLQQVHHDFTDGAPHRAVLVSMTVDELVRVLGDRPVIDGRPALVVDARPPDRLSALYRWTSESEPPSVAVRLVLEDEQGEAIGHLPVADPATLSTLVERWGDRGVLAVCVSASCLADPEFARRWLPTAPRPAFILVDVEPDRFVPRWAAGGKPVVAIVVHVTDTGGDRTALLLSSESKGIWWLAVADDITVRLMIEYVRSEVGDALRTDNDAFAAIRDHARVVITHILATESFTSFDAMASSHA
ncbi:hypothetical protein GCM10029963_74920 [Micromonospora andamanensis]|uniref:hypothetical protein n=1 Tax=Micromonospora andamanensis TaxID=1287068 RepID=UPI00194E0798|nr:hypothetical protein [Micromonospora andamanensis]GIJ42684.1 hypothetical protein Vwe01_60090 [Micromonospora andamanensis]